MSEHETNIVVCGLIHRAGRIFVARRAVTKKTFPGRFELPGGHVDLGETLEAALARELREELGIEVHIGQVAGAFTYTSENTFKCEVVYLCQMVDGAQEPALNPADHSEALWLGEGEIDRLEKDDDETEMLRRGFELLKQGRAG
jgi:8-oxo-dGTP diphosphatase